MSAKRDVLDDFRMLETEREKLLPQLVCWPQLLIWIARRDGELARAFDVDKDDPRREYALCQILRPTLAGEKAGSILGRSYDLDADREVKAAEESAYERLRAEVDPLTALAKSTSSRSLEQDTLYSVQRNVWNSAKIRAHETVGTIAQRGATYTAIRFRREDVLRFWPPSHHDTASPPTSRPTAIPVPKLPTKRIDDTWARDYVADMDSRGKQPNREQMRADAIAAGYTAKTLDVRSFRKKYASHWVGRGRRPAR